MPRWVIIEGCLQCPYYQDGDGKEMNWCGHQEGNEPVPDPEEIPGWCPLRAAGRPEDEEEAGPPPDSAPRPTV